jgi:hypothetical protein
MVVEGYDDDPAREDFHAAIRTFLALDPSVLVASVDEIYAYYRDVMDDVVAAGDDEWYVEIAGPQDVLDHVGFGGEPVVTRDKHGERRVYVSVECECDWEPEHGLQIVFRDGGTITKVGPCDGHLTNASTYADDRLANVVYRRRAR